MVENSSYAVDTTQKETDTVVSFPMFPLLFSNMVREMLINYVVNVYKIQVL